jgi:plastocyanin
MKLFAASWKRLSLAVLTVVLVVSSFVVFTPSASADTFRVKLGSDKGLPEFQPSRLTVKPGDTIEWVNNRLPPHNVVFDSAKNPDKSADLAKSLSHKQLLISPGQTHTTTIPADAPDGEYTFYCQPRRGDNMFGKLIVHR